MVEFEQAWLGEDSSLDVLMNEARSDGKLLGEKLHGTGMVSESDKGDLAIPPRNPLVVKDE